MQNLRHLLLKVLKSQFRMSLELMKKLRLEIAFWSNQCIFKVRGCVFPKIITDEEEKEANVCSNLYVLYKRL